MATVSFEHVTKHYIPEYAAVNDLNLEIADGEFIVLVGPSGCGKTTSLRMLAGLEIEDTGTIKIGDRVVNDVAPRDRDIAMVFQSYALYPHMTVYDNVAFGLRMRRTPRMEIERRVGDVAEKLGLAGYLKRKPRELSGGQRQRVALGRAIVRKPKVFLLDEPLSNLDAALRLETRVNLQRLHNELGTTFVYVTHDQVEAMTLGDRIAVMDQGVLQQVAPPMELYDRPANMYVAGFIGSPKMNFVEVTIEGDNAVAPGLRVPLRRAPALRKAILGLRPEHITERTPEGDAAPTVELTIDVSEVLGAEQYLYGKAGTTPLVARVDPHREARPGETAALRVDRRGIHLFDPETGAAVA
jgi:multiple sugar transport system ATP-binding protein